MILKGNHPFADILHGTVYCIVRSACRTYIYFINTWFLSVHARVRFYNWILYRLYADECAAGRQIRDFGFFSKTPNVFLQTRKTHYETSTKPMRAVLSPTSSVGIFDVCVAANHQPSPVSPNNRSELAKNTRQLNKSKSSVEKNYMHKVLQPL